IRAQRLADRLAVCPMRRAAVGAHEIVWWIDETLRPRKRMREDAAHVDVGRLVGETPRARADRGFEHDARMQRAPGVLASPSEERLADAPRDELAARVTERSDADDRHVDLVVAFELRDATDRSLRHAPFAERLVDTRDDFRSVRERHRARIEV